MHQALVDENEEKETKDISSREDEDLEARFLTHHTNKRPQFV